MRLSETEDATAGLLDAVDRAVRALPSIGRDLDNLYDSLSRGRADVETLRTIEDAMMRYNVQAYTGGLMMGNHLVYTVAMKLERSLDDSEYNYVVADLKNDWLDINDLFANTNATARVPARSSPLDGRVNRQQGTTLTRGSHQNTRNSPLSGVRIVERRSDATNESPVDKDAPRHTATPRSVPAKVREGTDMSEKYKVYDGKPIPTGLKLHVHRTDSGATQYITSDGDKVPPTFAPIRLLQWGEFDSVSTLGGKLTLHKDDESYYSEYANGTICPSVFDATAFIVEELESQESNIEIPSMTSADIAGCIKTLVSSKPDLNNKILFCQLPARTQLGTTVDLSEVSATDHDHQIQSYHSRYITELASYGPDMVTLNEVVSDVFRKAVLAVSGGALISHDFVDEFSEVNVLLGELGVDYNQMFLLHDKMMRQMRSATTMAASSINGSSTVEHLCVLYIPTSSGIFKVRIPETGCIVGVESSLYNVCAFASNRARVYDTKTISRRVVLLCADTTALEVHQRQNGEFYVTEF